MRYHYEKPSIYLSKYGVTYECNNVVFKKCTLYMINGLGLGVIQQRYEKETGKTFWSEIDPWLTDELYLHPGFKKLFYERAGLCSYSDGESYPTVTIRQMMWALKMKPLKKERWETCFDRRII